MSSPAEKKVVTSVLVACNRSLDWAVFDPSTVRPSASALSGALFARHAPKLYEIYTSRMFHNVRWSTSIKAQMEGDYQNLAFSILSTWPGFVSWKEASTCNYNDLGRTGGAEVIQVTMAPGADADKFAEDAWRDLMESGMKTPEGWGTAEELAHVQQGMALLPSPEASVQLCKAKVVEYFEAAMRDHSVRTLTGSDFTLTFNVTSFTAGVCDRLGVTLFPPRHHPVSQRYISGGLVKQFEGRSWILLFEHGSFLVLREGTEDPTGSARRAADNLREALHQDLLAFGVNPLATAT
jgi:hypothetical protein